MSKCLIVGNHMLRLFLFSVASRAVLNLYVAQMLDFLRFWRSRTEYVLTWCSIMVQSVGLGRAGQGRAGQGRARLGRVG